MKRIKIFLLNGILLSGSSLLIQIIGMFFSVYISNKVGTEAIGIYSLIMSVYFFAVTVANSGINLCTMRIISEQNAFGMEAGIKQAVQKCLIYSCIMGFFSFLLMLFLSSTISSYFLHNRVSSTSIVILAFSLPFISISSCIDGYFTALRKVKKTIFTQISGQIFRIIIVLFFLIFVFPNSLDYSCISLCLGITISEALSCALLIIFFLYDKRKLTANSYKDTNYIKQILRIAIPISFTSYIRSGLSSLKQLIIPLSLEKFGLSSELALSKYGIINGMVMPLITFPCSFISSFSLLLIPEFSSMNAKRQTNKINFSLEKILKFCFIFSFLIMGFFYCFSDELNRFIYPNTELSYFIKILCPLTILIYIDKVVDSVLKGLDKQVSVMGINILDLASSIFLIYFLLPIKGLNGYIIVLFVSEILNGLLSLAILIKQTHLKIDFFNWIIKPFSSIIFINALFKYFHFEITNIISLVILITCFCVLYFIIIFLLKAFVKKDVTIN